MALDLDRAKLVAYI